MWSRCKGCDGARAGAEHEPVAEQSRQSGAAQVGKHVVIKIDLGEMQSAAHDH